MSISVKKLLISLLLLLFAIGCFLGTWLRVTSGPQLCSGRYWLGTALLDVLITFAGLTILMGAILDLSFVHSLRSLLWRGWRPRGEVRSGERITWIVIGTIIALSGTLLVLNVLRVYFIDHCSHIPPPSITEISSLTRRLV